MADLDQVKAFACWCRDNGAVRVQVGDVVVEFGQPRVELKETDPFQGMAGEERAQAKKKRDEELLYGSA